jgi:hypothetical protein
MTRHEKHLARTLLKQIDGLTAEQTVRLLFERGLVNMRTCEQQAVRERMEQLELQGLRRCEAMHATAEAFCCSYEKIRSYYYNTYKS